MTISAKSGGAWHAGQLKRKVDGAWVDATLYRKVGGVWKTDAPLTATAPANAANEGVNPAGASITATAKGGVPPYSYAWSKVSGGDIVAASPGAATTLLAPGAAMAPGETRAAIFKCTITDSLGANVSTANAAVTLTRWSVPNVSALPGTVNISGTAANQSSGNVTASTTGGTAPFVYAWAKVSGDAITIGSPGAATTNFSTTGLAGGEGRTAIFRCTVTDAHGLTDAVDVEVTIARNVVITASASPTSISEAGATATFTTSASATVTPSGGTAPYNYAWTKVDGGAIAAVTPGAATTKFSATSLAAGQNRTALFNCAVTDTDGNPVDSNTVSVTIGRVTALVADISPSSLSGTGTTSTVTTSGSATAYASGGQGPYSYSWAKVSGGNITAVNPTSASSKFRGTGMGTGESRTATFRCTITDALGQVDSTTNVTVTVRNTASTGATYSPAAGTYNASDVGTVEYIVSASASVPWTWSYSGSAPASTVASGGSASSITFSLGSGLHGRSTTITLQSGGKTWTLNLTSYPDGEVTFTN